MNIFLLILLILLAAVLAVAAGFLIYAAVLQAKRPLPRLYDARAAQDDFIPLDTVPGQLLHFLLQLEDDKFYEHHGFSKDGIRDAVRLNRTAGKIITGGSSITQQLVKNLYFHFEQSYLRKGTESIITLAAERKLGKKKILELYVNIIYFGNGIYGLTHAARFYFGKEPEQLTANQMFILTCTVNAPTRGNPVQYPEVFERIRNKRLNLLIRRGTISDEDAEMIRSHHADCLDEELRENDAFTQNYPREICIANYRFGPYADPSLVTIPSVPLQPSGHAQQEG